MKAESMKHLQKMYEMCSDNGTIANMANLIIMKETIEAIIRIESEPKTKSKSKFKIWDYVGNDPIRPPMCCVLHDSGFKVASDAHILIALKEEYDPELEGKLMKKDGTFETENTKYPNWRMVIPDPSRMEMVPVKLDFAKIRGFESDYKARLKAAGYTPKSIEGYVMATENCCFKMSILMKAVKFMEHVGTDELMVAADGRRAALAVSGENKCIVMPVYTAPNESKYVYTL